MSKEDVQAFADALVNAKKLIEYCDVCGNFTDVQPCPICKGRSGALICVVKEPKDVLALEKVRDYKGVYHVLHGTISPMDGIGPDDIKIKELLARCRDGAVEEVIMATNTDVEGEATAMYIAKLLKTLSIRVTRIAHGIPIGSQLEYADEVTLSKAIENRKEM
jgi:recombination protein RecR